MFSVNSIICIVMLIYFMKIYEHNIDLYLDEALEEVSELRAQSVMNSSKFQGEIYFELQSQLINRTATFLTDLLSQKDNNKTKHFLDWQNEKPIKSFSEANEMFVTYLRDGRENLKIYNQTKLGFDFFGATTLDPEQQNDSKIINALLPVWSISMDMRMGGNTSKPFVD